MNTCICDSSGSGLDSARSRSVSWLVRVWHRSAAALQRRQAAKTLGALSEQLLADIGLHEPNVQTRVLGEDIRSIRGKECWNRSSLDFRDMTRTF